MRFTALTNYIDVAQIALYLFWFFFFGLLWYLRREDKREGYPLQSDRGDASGGRVVVQGYPSLPDAKVFRTMDGRSIPKPSASDADTRDVAAAPVGGWLGAPLEPTGNPMVDGVGPAAWAQRENAPEKMIDGSPMIVPMRLAPGWGIAARDPDPRGMTVVGCDGATAGTVSEVWVDRAEPQIRYLQVDLASGGRSVMLPAPFVRYDVRGRRVKVASITAAQFADVPSIASGDQITKLEEDKVCAYFGGGHLYATPDRLGPVL